MKHSEMTTQIRLNIGERTAKHVQPADITQAINDNAGFLAFILPLVMIPELIEQNSGGTAGSASTWALPSDILGFEIISWKVTVGTVKIKARFTPPGEVGEINGWNTITEPNWDLGEIGITIENGLIAGYANGYPPSPAPDPEPAIEVGYVKREPNISGTQTPLMNEELHPLIVDLATADVLRKPGLQLEGAPAPDVFEGRAMARIKMYEERYGMRLHVFGGTWK